MAESKQDLIKNYKLYGCSKKDLINLYEVSHKVLRKWLKDVEIGEYNGKRYTPNQATLIFNKIGQPA